MRIWILPTTHFSPVPNSSSIVSATLTFVLLLDASAKPFSEEKK